jgi:adenylate cyclase
MLTFRTSITSAVMVFIAALAAALIAILFWSFQLAAREEAVAHMNTASAETLGRLQREISQIELIVNVLSTSSSIADSNERTEIGPAIPLFKAALHELPQMDTIYVGYDNGGFLQVRSLGGGLPDSQRARLRAPVNTDYAISLIRPTPSGALPVRRLFEDKEGNELRQLDLWNFGYDPRKRSWYDGALKADHLLISSPYISVGIGAWVITMSAPLRGKVQGVVAADLKLDDFSNFVESQRPGEHGIAMMFDQDGKLIAHPDFKQFVTDALTDPSHPQEFNIKELTSLPATILKGWDGRDEYDGRIRDERGVDYLFRLRKVAFAQGTSLIALMISEEDDFAKDIQKLKVLAFALAMLAGGAFVPAAWYFGTKMSTSLKAITAEASKLRLLEAPDKSTSIRSSIKEVDELSRTVNLAQRAIWSFSRFVPRELVRRVVDNSISTELGGTRQEVTALFTDVRGFTTIAEAADPDALMHQTSRYFAELTQAFLAEEGTVDKFIGDAVMVFWNAPNPQPDHVERACRAALTAKAASDRLNSIFEGEGLQPFFTRFGIHVGEAIVGNLGSSERMNYTVLGSTVNLAARLEGLNKEYGTSILVSEEIAERAQSRFRFKKMGSVVAKGMTKETAVYELVEELR